jgi:hypothetical protein
MEDMARRCAEAFVRENGYTELPAEDSTRWVRESEDGGPWPRVLAARAGTLDRQASTVQCSMRECVVLFRVRRPMLLCAFRSVTRPRCSPRSGWRLGASARPPQRAPRRRVPAGVEETGGHEHPPV